MRPASASSSGGTLGGCCNGGSCCWFLVLNGKALTCIESNEFQVAIKWWLGMDVSFGSCWPYCPNHRLDPLGHHALTCKHGGDVVLRHNSFRDVLWSPVIGLLRRSGQSWKWSWS